MPTRPASIYLIYSKQTPKRSECPCYRLLLRGLLPSSLCRSTLDPGCVTHHDGLKANQGPAPHSIAILRGERCAGGCGAATELRNGKAGWAHAIRVLGAQARPRCRPGHHGERELPDPRTLDTLCSCQIGAAHCRARMDSAQPLAYLPSRVGLATQDSNRPMWTGDAFL